MKLQVLPARTGLDWVKLGIQTFFKQPLALGGLFFMFIAVVSVAAIIPVLGNIIGLMIVPAATLGLMVATLEALRGKFPMPSVLATAFRAGRQRLRAMLVLGAMYAAGFFLVMGITTLFDGGQFAKLYIVGGKLSRELLDDPNFQNAALVGVALYMPLSLLFWHAPALVHWHNVPPTKAIFFSAVACLRNFKAYLLYGLAWLAVFAGGTMLIVSALAMVGLATVAAAAIVPLALTLAAMFFSSIYFTFRDSFVHSEQISDPSAQNPPPNPPQ
jgi:hypothetical protein